LQWILHQRVAVAQRMLETSAVSIDEIAVMCGFGSAAGLRQHFTEVVGSTPSAYRSVFRHAAQTRGVSGSPQDAPHPRSA